MQAPIIPAVNLYAQQMELEANMTELGISRYQGDVSKNVERGREDESDYGLAIIRGYHRALSDGIRDFVEAASQKKAGRKFFAYPFIKDLDPDVIAYVALKVAVQQLTRTASFASVCHKIAALVEDETRYAQLRENDRGFYRWLKAEVDARSSIQIKRQTASRITRRMEKDDWEPWDAATRHRVGNTLLDLLIQTTGIVEVQEIIESARVRGRIKRKKNIVAPTSKLLEWIDRKQEVSSLLSPMYEPMIVPPVEWSAPKGGGYLSTFVRGLDLVKQRARGYIEELEEVEMPGVYTAINAAQNTAWQINPMILEILCTFWENGATCGGIPSRYGEELPPKPWDIDENEEARREWRAKASRVHAYNRQSLSRRLHFLYALGTANKYSLFPAIYFPHQFDFRGRMYAVPSLNPQGPDYMKALLRFAEGKPLGDDGWTWLAVHLANCGAFEKVDKAPLEARVDWVLTNQERILACARDPYNNRWWTEADSPYQFLAAAFEWLELVEHEAAGHDASTFVSKIPVGLDGSCSGLQHFSVAFRDEVGGAAVNLRVSDKPADIYTLVAEEVRRKCEQIADGEDQDRAELAIQWLTFGITRTLCKRPTMTFGYGSRQFGFTAQIRDDILVPAKRDFDQRGEGVWPFEGDGHKAAVFMAGLVYRAVGRTVIKAAEAMVWLRQLAKVAALAGLPVHWTTPDGFPVLQAYRDLASRRIATLICGNMVRTNVVTETLDISRRSQEQGISPNFIHSLDGCHLRMTVVAAVEEGLRHFALVHDSFGVHAGDTGRFFVLIREQLVRMYSENDVIQNFLDEIREQVEEEDHENIPPPPSPGKLDLQEVIESPFCFA